MSDRPPGWHHFPHVADVGVCGVAKSLAEAFEQAAVALTAVITDPALVACTEVMEIECDAPDVEFLLCDWLNALIYEMALRKVLFGCFDVKLTGTHLVAKAWGEAVDVARHHPAVEIKGATYTELKVYQEGDLWVAQCVVDV
jgi:SHS2 domain-containing protein